MKRLSILFCLFLFIGSFANAQKALINWGKVPGSDLEMTQYELDSSAAAVVLAHIGSLEFNFTEANEPKFSINIHKRIKILNKSAFDEGDISIPYYSKGRYEEIKGLKAHTITPDGEKHPVKNKEIFDENLSENWSAKKFTFPNLVEGAVIEYKYTFISQDLFNLEEWYFQEDIPVRHSELRMEIPEFYQYVVMNQGRSMDNTEKKSMQSQITIPKYVENISGVGSSQRGYQKIEAKIDIFRYVQKNVPALKKEPYITTMDDYVAKVKFQLSATKYPNSPYRPVLTDWAVVAKELIESENYGLQFQKNRFHKKLWAAAESKIQQGASEIEKIVLAYNFINSHIEWNKSYHYGVSETTLDKCFEKKQANSGELNLMLLALLQKAGINARPVLVSTRSNGKMQSLYPILNQFNHSMIVAEADGNTILLDAGNSFRPIGTPRVDALNYIGWLVDATQPQWINLVAPKANEKIFGQFSLSSDGKLTGNLTTSEEGYFAVSGRQSFQDSKEGKHVKEALTEEHPDIAIAKIDFENAENPGKAFKTKVACEIPNVAQVMDDFIYMSPALYGGFDENPFKLEERSYPVEIAYPIAEQFVLNLEIPAGYTVEEMPEPARVALPNKGGSFKFHVKHTGNQIQIVRTITLSQLRFGPEEYDGIKSFFDIIVEKQGEQIVLKRARP